jgi:hypothetical protein
MQPAPSHVFSSESVVLAPRDVVYNALINVGNFEHLSSTASGLKMLSANEFAGRGKPLFLRDVLAFKVAECKVGPIFLSNFAECNLTTKYTVNNRTLFNLLRPQLLENPQSHAQVCLHKALVGIIRICLLQVQVCMWAREW